MMLEWLIVLMNFPPTFLVALFRIFRRDGFAFFGKCARFAVSREAWLWLLRGGRLPGGPPEADVALIERSGWFDPEWFLREHPEAKRSGVSPARYYLEHDTHGTVCPGPDFIGAEYFALNPDVESANLNPLLHFEKYGRKGHRQMSLLENPREVFPEGTREFRRDFGVRRNGTRRVAVFAAHSRDGRVPETDLHYLRGLREVADRIVYVSSNPAFPEEADKLAGLASVVLFENHGEYDFGSYKRGFSEAEGRGFLDPAETDELVLANSSCYGPVVPFPESFRTMAERKCDFWGLTAYEGFGREHIQSYFFVFRRPVLDGGELRHFLSGVKRESNRWRVIQKYESRLTGALTGAGYRADTLVPWDFYRSQGNGRRWAFPPARPVTLLEKWRMPLVKVKTVDGENDEGRERLMEALRRANPNLAALVFARHGGGSRGEIPDADRPARKERLAYRDRLAAKVARISEKVRAGKKPVALFFISDASMFPAKPLFDAMVRDGSFDAKVVVVPDLRWPEAGKRLQRCRAALADVVPDGRLKAAGCDGDGIWEEETLDADIVCYASPYDISAFFYNPHYAVGRSFLPIHVNYGFYRSLYDREVMGRQNYAYFWKAFFECDATAKEYAEHSILKGANADVVGYVKMDALATAKPWPRNGNRKRVLIAPHHSVEGGANDSLSLSNFQRYTDYFLALPEKHPELDFVFRPHPFLFAVLSSPSQWGAKKTARWIARMKAHPNVRWSDEGDYFPAFASCDACVQDCGSYLVEWFYTGKPCCYLLKDPSDIGQKFAPLGQECLSHCYLAYDAPQIEDFLRRVVEGGTDPKAPARDEFRKSVMVNYPHAADAALAAIKRELGMA